MDNDDRKTIRDAISVLNEYGREAAVYLKAELRKEENAEAQAWIEDLYEMAD